MNKSFKVVFSKARGALMVVNELTSSVQAKGTKTVIAVAVASLVAGGAMAADTAKPGALLSWNGTELVGQAAGEGLVYSTKDGVLTITATGQKTGAEGVPGYGVLTNIYNSDATGGSDILAKTGVKISESTFTNNTSTNAGGAVTLWQDGSKDSTALAHSISGSTFSGNSANLGGAVALLNQMAFDKKDGATLSEGNVYTGNTAVTNGGAVYVEGSVLTSQNDVFVKNKAADASGKGGAIYVGHNGSVLVENGRFEENSAHRGGAILNEDGSLVIVRNSLFSKNTASQYGGALFHGNGQFEIYDSEFTGNTSGASGGAIATVFDVANTVKIVRSTFTENKGYLGGAMAIYFGLEVTDSKFTGNTTTGIDDGGGAITLGGHAKVSITGTTFDGNTANLGGAISTRPANGLDLGNATNTKGDGHWLQISNSTFTNNVATVKDELNNTIPWGDYGMLNGFGGAIATGFRGSTLNGVYHGNYIEDSTFTGNKASYGGDVFANLSDTVKTVDASNSSVALGQSEESKGSVNVETLKVKNLEVVGTFDAVNAEVESLDVSGNFTAAELKVAEGDVTGTLSADKLTGTADKVINVGDDVDAGTVHLDTLALNGGTIFLDPSWTGDDTIDKGSFLAVTNLKDSVLTGRIVVGQNSTLALGGTKAETVDAFNRLGKSWGEDGVTAALYVGKTLSADVLKDAGILVDGSLEDRTAAGDLTSLSGIKMNAGSMLIVNQAGVGSGTAIDGKLAMSAASTLGIVNATEGTFKLASDLTVNAVDQDTTVEVVTDNPFISGSFGTGEKANTVTTTFDSESGLGAIASTGVQAMARRADFVMTETVANRTSLDQPMHAGVNLWADVSGERYEADKLDNNGSFRADAAYATFGGDVEVLEGLTAGLALQYGDASLRSDVSGIKNDITSYGLTAYAGKSFGAAKVVGELAWLKSENDITAHQTALNQKLDANIYSAGVRAQYELAAGSFKFVPSIGLRVSRLETDDMTVGSIKVDEGDLTYVQMPISLRISGFEADAAGWTLAPSFKVAYVPTFGDKEVKVLGYSQDVLDMSPVQADFGLRAVNGNLMFNVDMMLGGGEAGTSSIGGKVGVKYAF